MPPDPGPGPGSLLRREVGLFRVRERRRVFESSVHVGTPAGARESFVVTAQDRPVVDAGLSIDVVCALLERADGSPRNAWLCRPGHPAVHDDDLRWLAAATVAFGIHGERLDGFYAITRTGWLDVRTGQHRVWKRLRL
jgi:hypothetical protein